MYRRENVGIDQAIQDILYKLDNEPIEFCVIGIAGGSASGKSYLAQELGNSRDLSVLSMDDYYKGADHMKDMNFDHPSSLDLALLGEHVAALREGESINKPIYDFATHSRSGHEEYHPHALVALEGLYALSDIFRDTLNMKVFIDASEDVRFERRMKRDIEERGRTKKGVTQQWEETVEPMYREFIHPQKEHADIIVINH